METLILKFAGYGFIAVCSLLISVANLDMLQIQPLSVLVPFVITLIFSYLLVKNLKKI